MANKSFKLLRTKQCGKCPWKVSVDPNDIPDGYCEIKHKNLSNTISDGKYRPEDFNKPMNVMACHHSDGDDQMYCIGWLNNQLGVGNNIRLRLSMMHCENIAQIKTYGEQHKTFEDTLPKKQ
jgi:hypothetical protein